MFLLVAQSVKRENLHIWLSVYEVMCSWLGNWPTKCNVFFRSFQFMQNSKLKCIVSVIQF